MRESPAIPIVEGLVAGGATVRAYDPAAMAQARPLLPASVVYCEDAYEAARGADGVVIVTEWNQFRALELDRAARPAAAAADRRPAQPLRSRRVAAAGFRYVSVGRSHATPGGQGAS